MRQICRQIGYQTSQTSNAYSKDVGQMLGGDISRTNLVTMVCTCILGRQGEITMFCPLWSSKKCLEIALSLIPFQNYSQTSNRFFGVQENVYVI